MSKTIERIEVSCEGDTAKSISKSLTIIKRAHPTNNACIILDYKKDGFTLSEEQAKKLIKALREIYTNI